MISISTATIIQAAGAKQKGDTQSKADRAKAITKLGKKHGVDFQFANL